MAPAPDAANVTGQGEDVEMSQDSTVEDVQQGLQNVQVQDWAEFNKNFVKGMFYKYQRWRKPVRLNDDSDEDEDDRG